MIIKETLKKEPALKLGELIPGDVFRFDDSEYDCKTYAMRTENGFMWLAEGAFSNFKVEVYEKEVNLPVIKYKATLTIEGEA